MFNALKTYLGKYKESNSGTPKVNDITSQNDSINQNKTDWKYWSGKVIGTEEDIKIALKTLQRSPKDAQELENLIFIQRGEKLEATLAKAKQSLS